MRYLAQWCLVSEMLARQAIADGASPTVVQGWLLRFEIAISDVGAAPPGTSLNHAYRFVSLIQEMNRLLRRADSDDGDAQT